MHGKLRRLLTLGLLTCALTLLVPSPAAWAEASSTIKVKIQTSEVLSLFYMAESITRHPSRSTYLRDIYEATRGDKLDVEASLSQVFMTAPTGITFHEQRHNLPTERHSGQNYSDILEIMALQADDLDDFLDRTRALMPVSAHARFAANMRALDPLHREHVWEPSSGFLADAKLDLERARSAYKMEELLQRISTFYGSDWPSSEPIIIGLIPIPGKREAAVSYAHSAGAYEFVEVLEHDHTGARFGVLIHELCHSLYEAQPPSLQLTQSQWFRASKTLSAYLAATEINEAVATAIGNGWVEADIQGQDVMKLPWYNDPVIDKFSKAIYPPIKAYLEQGKQWDKKLNDQMIEAFREAFPESFRSTMFVFQDIAIFEDTKSKLEDSRDAHGLFRRVRSVRYARPVEHPMSLKAYDETQTSTSIFLLGQESAKRLKGYPFYKKHRRRIDAALAKKKPFYWATRATPDKRLVVIVGLGGLTSARPIYEELASPDLITLDKIVTLPTDE